MIPWPIFDIYPRPRSESVPVVTCGMAIRIPSVCFALKKRGGGRR